MMHTFAFFRYVGQHLEACSVTKFASEKSSLLTNIYSVHTLYKEQNEKEGIL